MPKLKKRSISQRNAEITRRVRERRTDDEVRLLDNRRRANSLKIERQNHEFKTKEKEKEAKL